MLHDALTEKIIEAFYRVYNTLGYGFLEKVYEQAMDIELEAMGIEAVSQKPIRVCYHGQVVGEYFADLLVEEKVIVELKASAILREEHEAQLINYLKATNIEIGLLLNFGKRALVKRKIFHNHLK